MCGAVKPEIQLQSRNIGKASDADSDSGNRLHCSDFQSRKRGKHRASMSYTSAVLQRQSASRRNSRCHCARKVSICKRPHRIVSPSVAKPRSASCSSINKPSIAANNIRRTTVTHVFITGRDVTLFLPFASDSLVPRDVSCLASNR